MKRPRRILLVDDHAFVRRAIRRLLETEPGLAVCAEAAGRGAALRALRLHHPDLLVLDLVLPGRDGLMFTSEIRRAFPDLPILLLSLQQESLFAEAALRAGADGYLMKNDAPEHLVEAVHALMDRRLYVSPRMSQTIFCRLRGTDRPAAPPGAARGPRAARFNRPVRRTPVRTPAR